MSKKIFKRFLYAVIFTVILSCGNKEPIKIGFIAQLSGRQSQLGVDGRNGTILAINNINKDGETPYDLANKLNYSEVTNILK